MFSRNILGNLFKTAEKLEDFKKIPLDIEFAVEGRDIHIIQMRPVSTENFDNYSEFIWSDLNVTEAFPGCVSPLTVSFTTEMINRICREHFKRLGLNDLLKIPVLTDINNKLYFNLSLILSIAEKFSFAKSIKDEIEELIGGYSGGLNTVKQGIRVSLEPVTLVRGIPYYVSKLKKINSSFDKIFQDYRYHPLMNSSVAEKPEDLFQIFETACEVLEIQIFVSGMAMSLISMLNRFIELRLGGTGKRVSSHLTGELGNLEEFDFIKFVRGITNGKKICDDQIALVKKMFGFMIVDGMDLYRDRLKDRDNLIVDILNLSQDTERSVDEFSKTSLMKRNIKRRLSRNFTDGIIFDVLLSQSKKFLEYRERTKILGLRYFSRIKEILEKTIITSIGLKNRSDIHFLYLEELRRLIHGCDNINQYRSKIVSRKLSYENSEKNNHPSIIEYGKPVYTEKEEENTGKVLKGLPGGAGCVEGIARIVKNLDKSGNFTRGDILVVPRLDPSHTFLISQAGGIVTDTGGVLSHGSIIAREFGIPLVLNTLNGTSVIKDGQYISIDGMSGKIAFQ